MEYGLPKRGALFERCRKSTGSIAADRPAQARLVLEPAGGRRGSVADELRRPSLLNYLPGAGSGGPEEPLEALTQWIPLPAASADDGIVDGNREARWPALEQAARALLQSRLSFAGASNCARTLLVNLVFSFLCGPPGIVKPLRLLPTAAARRSWPGLGARLPDDGNKWAPRPPAPSAASLGGTADLSGAAAVAGFEAFGRAVEAGHMRTISVLRGRLAGMPRVRAAWSTGFASEAVANQGRWDDALLYGMLLRLQKHTTPIPPRPLAALLRLALHLAQSSREDHAVAAVRFALQSLDVSFPPVVQALRNVSTPRATWDACEAVVAGLEALYTAAKTMARSVRVTRISNGPLSPLCRKLKAALEQALVTAGRRTG